jgi:phosphate transport system substrate-binding protein
LYLHSYPLTREVYLALTDLRGTLPAGFAHFMLGEKGQRLILKSGLVPANKPGRTVVIKKE